MPRPEDFFTLNEISARRLLLVGYRLFPTTDLLLHPRMTVLSGNNAVGKTTLLDAVQTIFICHLRHINLNVATGHSDRNLSGQLAGQVAWACVAVSGHEQISGIGVRLRRKPGSEGVELSPFTLQGISPDLSLFLDGESLQITSDLQLLGQKVLRKDPAARVLPFESVDAFHRFLHAEGLFPLDLSGSRKQLFSNLWRQVSQPRLDRLHGFLEEMLCPRSQAKKLGFDEVDRLIKDRRNIESNLNRLEKFRQLRRELEDKIVRLDQCRLAYLGLSLTLAGQRMRTLQERRDKDQARQEALRQKLARSEDELSGLKAELEANRGERDKLLRRQTDLAAKLRHYQEYQEAQSAIPGFKTRLQGVELDLQRCREALAEVRQETETLSRMIAELEKKRAVGQEREKPLESEAGEWKSLREIADQCESLIQVRIDSKDSFRQVWQDFQSEWQAFQSLKAMRRELQILEKRSQDHQAALQTRHSLLRSVPELEAGRLQPDVLQHYCQTWRQDLLKCWEDKRRMQERQHSLQKDWDQLAKGRPPLPEGPNALIDQGLAKPFAARFEHMDLDEAALWQARIGPFAHALEFFDHTDLPDQSGQEDAYLVVTGSDTLKTSDWNILARSEHGVLAGRSGVGWFTPQGPVWLGAQARSRQMSALKTELLELEKSLEENRQELDSLQSKEAKATELLHTWQAYQDGQAPREFERLRLEIKRLEDQGPVIQKKHRLLSDLMQRTHAFSYRKAPAALDSLRKELANLEKQLEKSWTRQAECTENLRKLREEEAGHESRHKQYQQDKSRLESRLEDLRREEPLEVLEGRVDFAQEADLQERITALDKACSRLEASMDALKESRGALKNELAGLSETLAITEKELQQTGEETARARENFQAQYPELEVPTYARATESERQKAAAGWEHMRSDLHLRIEDLSRQFDLALPQGQEPDRCVAYILESLLPPQVDLDNQEEKLQELRNELAGVEKQIRTYVEQIRKGVDQEIHRLDRRLSKVNRILEPMRFGKISRISLKREFMPAYEGLRNLRGARLTLFQLGQEVSLQEFIDQIRQTIFRYGRGAELKEDQILDYRSYVRLSWVIEDEEGNLRSSGFSGGEGLGINLAICLSLLFYFGQDQGTAGGQGVLIMALDEAERLDDTALATIRRLLEQVHCQLLVALPRTIQVPSSICHMLTPLPQGVTHISVYHREEDQSSPELP